LDFGTRRAARPVPKVKKFLVGLMPEVFDLIDVPNVTASAFVLILCDRSKTLLFDKRF
jgi:hypothetical protein